MASSATAHTSTRRSGTRTCLRGGVPRSGAGIRGERIAARLPGGLRGRAEWELVRAGSGAGGGRGAAGAGCRADTPPRSMPGTRKFRGDELRSVKQGADFLTARRRASSGVGSCSMPVPGDRARHPFPARGRARGTPRRRDASPAPKRACWLAPGIGLDVRGICRYCVTPDVKVNRAPEFAVATTAAIGGGSGAPRVKSRPIVPASAGVRRGDALPLWVGHSGRSEELQCRCLGIAGQTGRFSDGGRPRVKSRGWFGVTDGLGRGRGHPIGAAHVRPVGTREVRPSSPN